MYTLSSNDRPSQDGKAFRLWSRIFNVSPTLLNKNTPKLSFARQRLRRIFKSRSNGCWEKPLWKTAEPLSVTYKTNLQRIRHYLSRARWTRFIVRLSKAIPRKLIWEPLRGWLARFRCFCLRIIFPLQSKHIQILLIVLNWGRWHPLVCTWLKLLPLTVL